MFYLTCNCKQSRRHFVISFEDLLNKSVIIVRLKIIMAKHHTKYGLKKRGSILRGKRAKRSMQTDTPNIKR